MLALVVFSPSRLGPYEIVRPLGAGGMAETFVAMRRGPAGFEQRVCLRKILPAYASEPKFVEQFLDEARLLAHLHNANIVQVFDFGQVDGIYYMALELVDGVDLEVLLSSAVAQHARLPVAVACYIGGQLLSALDYAHGLAVGGTPLNLVHRDVSPANVLLSGHGEVKLTDFGIAKASTRKHKTRTGYTKGKLAYMSPEQVRGDELDSGSDLFAVGVVLYEMLAGCHPFEADTDPAIINNILTGKRPSLSELAPGLPEQLLRLIDLLLQPDRRLRPASAGDALRMLPFLEPNYVSQRTLSQLVSARQTKPAVAPAAVEEPRLPRETEVLATEPLRSTGSSPELADRATPVGTPPAARPIQGRTARLFVASLLLGGAFLASGLYLVVREQRGPTAGAEPAVSKRALGGASGVSTIHDAGARPPEPSVPNVGAPPAVSAHKLPQVVTTGNVDSTDTARGSDGGASSDGQEARESRRRRSAKAAREVKDAPQSDPKGRGHSGVSVSADEF